jgi:multiple sugar transport system ATP-binding protein
LRPATLGVAKLFGDPSINTIETTVSANGNSVPVGGADIEVDGAYVGLAGREIIFGVRPEAITMTRGRPGLPATVLAVTPLNERVVLLLKSAGGWEFLASLPSASVEVPEPDSQVAVSFVPEGVHLFDRITGERLNG